MWAYSLVISHFNPKFKVLVFGRDQSSSFANSKWQVNYVMHLFPESYSLQRYKAQRSNTFPQLSSNSSPPFWLLSWSWLLLNTNTVESMLPNYCNCRKDWLTAQSTVQNCNKDAIGTTEMCFCQRKLPNSGVLISLSGQAATAVSAGLMSMGGDVSNGCYTLMWT